MVSNKSWRPEKGWDNPHWEQAKAKGCKADFPFKPGHLIAVPHLSIEDDLFMAELLRQAYAFEAGANAMLEAIRKVINNPEQWLEFWKALDEEADDKV